jgi:hypothetical protein
MLLVLLDVATGQPDAKQDTESRALPKKGIISAATRLNLSVGSSSA